jgi:hypothetical protein
MEKIVSSAFGIVDRAHNRRFLAGKQIGRRHYPVITRPIRMNEFNLFFLLRAHGQPDIVKEADWRESTVKSKTDDLNPFALALLSQPAILGTCDKQLMPQLMQAFGEDTHIDTLSASKVMNV